MYTDKLFTGQREMAGLGIYHYGARFYSPKLGRFLSADTIVPGYANPQNLNRFSYVRNNPLRYTDPTGHLIDEGCGCANTGTVRRTGLTMVAGRPTRNSDSGRTFSTAAQNNNTPNIFVPVTPNNEPYINVPVSGDNLPGGFTPVPGDDLPAGFTPVSGGPVVLINVPVPPLDDIFAADPSTEPDFPEELQGGESNNYVYIGYDENGDAVYAGITNDPERRQDEHGDRFIIDPLNDENSRLTRGQVRAIEQALMVNNEFPENAINSISPRHPYYQEAVDWGNWWLEENGHTWLLPDNES